MYGKSAPPTTSSIEGSNWERRDISGESFESVKIGNVDLSEVASTGATFNACRFVDCRFGGVELTKCAFLNCTFVGCRFFDAKFAGCKFVGSMFDRCNFDNMHAEGGDWSFVGLPGADLSRATFKDLRMRDADLTGANCKGARLLGVDLVGAYLHAVNFESADLRGSEFTTLDPKTAQLAGAAVDLNQAIEFAQLLGLEVNPDPVDA